MGSERPVISGMPQGTVIGPILFLVCIALMGSNLSTGTIFADNTWFKCSITAEEECTALQEDLEMFDSWEDKVNMNINQDKFKALYFWADRSSSICL